MWYLLKICEVGKYGKEGIYDGYIFVFKRFLLFVVVFIFVKYLFINIL